MLNNYPFQFWPFWPALFTLLALVFVLDLVLRAVSLWRAARASQTAWFIALLILNTVGILPLIYLLFFAKEPLFEMSETKAAKKSAKDKLESKK
jgi:uncharacterized membrane protein